MDWRKFFNTLLIMVVLCGLGYYRLSSELPKLMMEHGVIPTSDNVAFQQRATLLLLAMVIVPPFVIWAVLIFLDERDMLPAWRWPWQRRKHLEGASRGSGSLDHLLTLCAGDRELAERLVQSELKRNPGLKRGEAIQKAASRLEYDRSR